MILPGRTTKGQGPKVLPPPESSTSIDLPHVDRRAAAARAGATEADHLRVVTGAEASQVADEVIVLAVVAADHAAPPVVFEPARDRDQVAVAVFVTVIVVPVSTVRRFVPWPFPVRLPEVRTMGLIVRREPRRLRRCEAKDLGGPAIRPDPSRLSGQPLQPSDFGERQTAEAALRIGADPKDRPPHLLGSLRGL